jgi:polar amino acid transport system permease protein
MAELLAEAPRFFGYYNLILIGRAFLSTALLAFAANALGLVVGFALAILRTERIVRFAPLRWVATAYVEIFRRIPFLVMLMGVFFVFQYSGFDVGLFEVAMTALGLSSSAFLAEIIRAGLRSVHPNQWDAAEALNMSGLTALRLVILPQAWGVIIPPSLTQSVGLVKSTSIVSQIGLMELTKCSISAASRRASASAPSSCCILPYAGRSTSSPPGWSRSWCHVIVDNSRRTPLDVRHALSQRCD